MAEFASNGKGNLGVTLGAIGTGLAAFDILPNGHAIYCFPLKGQISSPIFLNKDVKINKSFIDFKKTEENLNKKFQKVEENLFCLDCRICEYYSSRICDGVCPALLKKDIAL